MCLHPASVQVQCGSAYYVGLAYLVLFEMGVVEALFEVIELCLVVADLVGAGLRVVVVVAAIASFGLAPLP